MCVFVDRPQPNEGTRASFGGDFKCPVSVDQDVLVSQLLIRQFPGQTYLCFFTGRGDARDLRVLIKLTVYYDAVCNVGRAYDAACNDPSGVLVDVFLPFSTG